jgi:hypothetical protein
MSSRGGDWLGPLRDAAADDDPRGFDAVMDQVLERARDEASPDVGLEALVAERLRMTLAACPDSAQAQARGRLTRSLAATSSRWARYGKGLGLLGAGVALGFVWGRSPLWWPAPHGAAPDALVESVPARPDTRRPPAPATAREAIGTEGHREDAAALAGDEERRLGRTQPPERLPAPVRALPTRARSTPASVDGSLRVALEQLRKAQLLLRESQPKQALQVLDLLDARVATTVLQEEREVTRALALCDAGDVTAAGALARRFLERAPDSAYAVSLRESCAGKAALLDQMRDRTSNPPR